jgi:hypothetical protein
MMLKNLSEGLLMSIKQLRDKIMSSGEKRKKKMEERAMQEWVATERLLFLN